MLEKAAENKKLNQRLHVLRKQGSLCFITRSYILLPASVVVFEKVMKMLVYLLVSSLKIRGENNDHFLITITAQMK